MSDNGDNSQNPTQDPTEDMPAEYDFSHGVRGKHAESMRNGYKVVIHRGDGATEVREVAARPGAVILAPDVRKYFPDSEAVNRTLRGLISLIPHESASSKPS